MAELGLAIDHASLQVPNLAAALTMLGKLGLTATRTPGADHHSRVHFDRAYLEVSVPKNRPVPGARFPLWFLGAKNVLPLLPELKARGVGVQQVGVFEGADGTWDDVVLGAPDPLVPTPVLVSRKEPAEVAANWPPPLTVPHENGAERLASILVATPAFSPAVEFLEKLGGVADRETELPAFNAIRKRVRFGNGRIDLLRGARKGRVSDWLATRGPGVIGVSIAVKSMEKLAKRLLEQGLDGYAGDGEIFTDAPFGPDALFGFEPL